MLAALVACQGGGIQNTRTTAACYEHIATFEAGERASYLMNFGAAEEIYLAVKEQRRLNRELAHCADGFSDAQLATRLANAQSSQLQFLAAAEQLATAQSLGGGSSDASAHEVRELAAFEMANELHLQRVLGWVDTPADQKISTDLSGKIPVEFTDGQFIALPFEIQRLIKADILYLYNNSAALIELRQFQNAQRSIDTGLKKLSLVPNTAISMTPRFHARKSWLRLEQGQNSEAVKYARMAVSGLERVAGNSSVLAQAKMLLGISLQRNGEGQAALEAFDEALALYDQNPVTVEFERMGPIFRLGLTSILSNLDNVEEWNERIFRAAQLVRSSKSVQSIARTARVFADSDGAAGLAVRQWKVADARSAAAKGRLSLARQNRFLLPEHIELLEAAVAQSSDAASRARQRVDNIAPGYRRALQSPVSLTDIRSHLRAGEAFVQVLLGYPRSLIILVLPEGVGSGQQGVVIRPINADRKTVEGLVRNLRETLETVALEDGLVGIPQFPADYAFQLYNMLFGAIDKNLEGLDRIFISSNGLLRSFPFEALVTADPGGGIDSWAGHELDYSNVAWLGDKVEISYLPAARNLVDLRAVARPSKALKSVLAFGDYRPGVAAETVMRSASLPDGCLAFAEAVAESPALEGTGPEAEYVTSVLGNGAEPVLGDAFTEAEVKRRHQSGSLRDFRILHFATHGLLPSSADCFTEPALAASFDPAGTGDGLLTTTEIREFDLDAQLVVLSACETIGAQGRAEETVGDSLSNLAHAFFDAGSRSVVASHWQVLSEETTTLMAYMYDGIAENKGFGAALQEAQRKLRRDPFTSHPTFWAGFVLVGDGAQSLYPERQSQSAAVSR